MGKYRKLGRTSSQRKALLRSQVTALIQHGRIVTTEARAKEVRKIADGLVAAAIREKDNFDEVTVTAMVRELPYMTKLRRRLKKTVLPVFMQEGRFLRCFIR